MWQIGFFILLIQFLILTVLALNVSEAANIPYLSPILGSVGPAAPLLRNTSTGLTLSGGR